MTLNDFLTALGLAHAAGMLVTALWFYPVYFKKNERRRCIDIAHFCGVTLLGWISIVCLFIDLNNNKP